MSLVRKTNHDSKKDRDHPILLRGRGDFLFHRNAHVRFFAVAPFVAALKEFRFPPEQKY